MGVQLREKKLSGDKISYYLDFYHNGKRWYETLEIHVNKKKPTEDDKEKKLLAQQIKCKRETELITQGNDLVDTSKRKADFVTWWESYLAEKNGKSKRPISSLKALKLYVNKKPLSFNAITPDFLKGFSKFLLTKVKNNSARNYLADMTTALADAVRDEIILVNPFSKLKKKDKIKAQDIFRHAFTMEQLQKLSDATTEIPLQTKQAFFFSCFCGLRWSDVNGLKWTEVIVKVIENTERHFVYFDQQKTTNIEYFPLGDEATEIIKARKTEATKNNENSPYVFPTIKEQIKGKNRYKQVNYQLKKWGRDAGIDVKLMKFHAGRHTFATNVLENSSDGDLYTVSKLLGHKSIQPTQIYAHVRDKKKYDAVKSLPTLRLVPSKSETGTDKETPASIPPAENRRPEMNIPKSFRGKFKPHNLPAKIAA